MDQIPITNALAAQSQVSGQAPEVAAMLGATASGTDQSFGVLLSQQLQQLLTQFGVADPQAGGAELQAGKGLLVQDRVLPQGGGADVAPAKDLAEGDAGQAAVVSEDPGVDALPKALGLNAQLALGREADAGKEHGHGGPREDGPWHASMTGRPGLALAVGRGEENGEAGGKKLPQDLPKEDQASPVVLTDPSSLAAAAQASAAVLAQAAKSAALPDERKLAGDAGLNGVNLLAGKEVLASKGEARALAEPEVVPTLAQPQATPQSFAHMMSERVSGQPSVPATPTLEVPQRIDTPQWSSGVGDKVVWMLGTQTQGAELRLNPPALGPLEVRVSMSDGQATLSFMTPHAPVREAIEAAAPRLREMLGDSGINLGSVSVNVGTFAQQQQPGSQNSSAERQSGAGQWTTHFSGSEDGSVAASTLVSSVRYLRDGGMVDLFA